jgi:hypothetical protein
MWAASSVGAARRPCIQPSKSALRTSTRRPTRCLGRSPLAT